MPAVRAMLTFLLALACALAGGARRDVASNGDGRAVAIVGALADGGGNGLRGDGGRRASLDRERRSGEKAAPGWNPPRVAWGHVAPAGGCFRPLAAAAEPEWRAPVSAIAGRDQRVFIRRIRARSSFARGDDDPADG